MTITRDYIIEEIRRTAETNGGKALGRQAFLAATGIRETDWRGRFWARWNDVLLEAGFSPNTLNEAMDETLLLDRFAGLALELGRLPVFSELRLKKRQDPSFPNEKTYARFGSKGQLLLRLKEFCSPLPQYAALLPMLDTEVKEPPNNVPAPQAADVEGFVYLVKMGKHFKIGKTFAVPRRHRELALELPEKLEPVHVIRTDDPGGIETYWHKRFQDKGTNGEWFALSPDDVRIFKKRRFM